MYVPGDQFFTGTGLSRDQNRGVIGTDSLCYFIDIPHAIVDHYGIIVDIDQFSMNAHALEIEFFHGLGFAKLQLEMIDFRDIPRVHNHSFHFVLLIENRRSCDADVIAVLGIVLHRHGAAVFYDV